MLILASASQSRKKLLENAQIEFIQIASDFDENLINNDNIANLALDLSYQKANHTLKKIEDKKLRKNIDKNFFNILGCDSIFEFKGLAYGKPKNIEEASKRWFEMSGEYGYLHTGHTLIISNFNDNKISVTQKITQIVSSKVLFAKLEKKEIIKYVNTLEPLNCAGGFALEGIGGKYIEKIEGCYSNVMGLSLPWLRKNLLALDILA